MYEYLASSSLSLVITTVLLYYYHANSGAIPLLLLLTSIVIIIIIIIIITITVIIIIITIYYYYHSEFDFFTSTNSLDNPFTITCVFHSILFIIAVSCCFVFLVVLWDRDINCMKDSRSLYVYALYLLAFCSSFFS